MMQATAFSLWLTTLAVASAAQSIRGGIDVIPKPLDTKARLIKGAGAPGACIRDGVMSDTEMCDSGAVVAGSGCDEKCRIVWGYTCDGPVGARSHCEKVSQDVCYWASFPRCGPQGSGTIMKVIGEGFRRDYEYQARFSLKGSNGHPPTGVTPGHEVMYATGIWISETEVRFMVPPHTEVTMEEGYKEANVALVVKSNTNTNATGNMFKCDDRPFATGQDQYPGLYTTTQFRYSYNSRTQLFASNMHKDNVVLVDAVTQQISDFTDPSGQGGILRRPYGLDIGPDGALYVASGGTREILRFDSNTGGFLNVFAKVDGEPRGIRFRENVLYVIDAAEGGRVLMYEVRSAWNPRSSRTNAYFGKYLGVFSDGKFASVCEKRDETMNKMPVSTLDSPWEIRFQAHKGALRMFISSMHRNRILMFDGLNGEYQGVFTEGPCCNMGTGFDFSHQQLGVAGDPNYSSDPDLFFTGSYSGNILGRFNGTTGKFKGPIEDRGLIMAAGVLTNGEEVFVGAKDGVRRFDIGSGRQLPTMPQKNIHLGHMVLAQRCH